MISDKRIDDALQLALKAGEVGIQVAAYLGEELIVDAWAGARDGTGAPVEASTLFPIFSASKAMISILTLLRAEQGFFSLDEPIAKYWPEYANRGKEAITVRHVLAHKAGVPQMPTDLATDEGLADWAGIIRSLEQMAPLSAPMERAHYHGVSIYYLLGEVLRRTDPQGRQFDELFADEICVPLKIKDLWFRLPAAEDHRVAELTYGAQAPANWAIGRDVAKYAMMCPPAHRPTPENHNRPAIRRLLQGNAYTTARAGARFWSLVANGGKLGGVRLLSEATIAALAVPAGDPDAVDEITGQTPCYSLGLRISGPTSELAPVIGASSRVVCHTGGGGTLGWADLSTGLAVMYTHNRMGSNQPFAALGEAVRAVAADHG
jgi:CubicO group peptidase (beta-lactamase class C family)